MREHQARFRRRCRAMQESLNSRITRTLRKFFKRTHVGHYPTDAHTGLRHSALVQEAPKARPFMFMCESSTLRKDSGKRNADFQPRSGARMQARAQKSV